MLEQLIEAYQKAEKDLKEAPDGSLKQRVADDTKQSLHYQIAEFVLAHADTFVAPERAAAPGDAARDAGRDGSADRSAETA